MRDQGVVFGPQFGSLSEADSPKVTVKFNDAESRRLREARDREGDWKFYGPYLSERQWGTVREDYSAEGKAWSHFPHDHARSRTYRFGEDGLLGWCDRRGRLCFSVALWNEQDPILKERLFGLTGPEGNHGEDVKELYYYLRSTPTHSFCKGLYKYPQSAYPYDELVRENRSRNRLQREYELLDTGALDEERYFDIEVSYAKASPSETFVRMRATNRGPEAKPLHLLPQVWFRNTWSWGREGEDYTGEPSIENVPGGASQTVGGEFAMQHEALPDMSLQFDPGHEELLFTDNETNATKLFDEPDRSLFKKDAFHECVVNGIEQAVCPAQRGTKAAVHYKMELAPGESRTIYLRLAESSHALPEGGLRVAAEAAFRLREEEHDTFYKTRLPGDLTPQEREVALQSHAGLLWTKQFYHYVVRDWLEGDPGHPEAPAARRKGRNKEWGHLYNRDVISMPDKWEYPWYAAWDLAFHMVPFSTIDVDFSKRQLKLFLREWYMHPSGQMPAYEFALGDVNPPVHAWAVWRVYQESCRQGDTDIDFLEACFHKLLINFTWWVNRKDDDGNNLFSGGFLGLDNIGVFDRSKPLPTGGHLEQADGTAWMAFYACSMLTIALELARSRPAYGDIASKFFEHYVAIVDAMNHLGGSGLWDEPDGFYYDILRANDTSVPIKIRSLVGLLPLCTAFVLSDELLEALPEFKARVDWFFANRKDFTARSTATHRDFQQKEGRTLFAVPSRRKLLRILEYVLDESEFLSPFGVRSLSKAHEKEPYSFWVDREEHRVAYLPGESDSWMFGGNSNWRGPVWFPMNFLLLEALGTYHEFFGNDLVVACPRGSDQSRNLKQVQQELAHRLVSVFLPDQSGARPCHGDDTIYQSSQHFRDLVLFYEHFHGDSGRGLGASHQTGWTSLVTSCMQLFHRDAPVIQKDTE